MAFTKTVTAAPADPSANWLLGGKAWDLNGSGRGLPNGVITYSFPDNSSDYGKGGGNGFQPFLPSQKGAFYPIFDGLEALTNVDFVEVRFDGSLGDNENGHVFTASDGSAILRYSKTSKLGPDSSYTYLPSEKANGGDSLFGNATQVFDGSSTGEILPGTYAYTVLLHEIGHGLGLEHSFDRGPYGVVPANQDSLEYTVMSYSSFVGANDWYNETLDFPQTFMMLDIASLQVMYGADFTTNYGNTTYSWQPGENTIFMTVWDGGGIDTYDTSNYDGGVEIDLRPGEWTTVSTSQLADLNKNADGVQEAAGNIANSLLRTGSGPDGKPTNNLIENAIGGDGSDIITGNVAANQLSGGEGADYFTYTQLNESRGAAVDRILDFDTFDFVDIERLDAVPNSAGNQDFVWHNGIDEYQDLSVGEIGFIRSANGSGGMFYAKVDADQSIDFQVSIAFSGRADFTSTSVFQDNLLV